MKFMWTYYIYTDKCFYLGQTFRAVSSALTWRSINITLSSQFLLITDPSFLKRVDPISSLQKVYYGQFSSAQCLSHVQLLWTPRTTACQASLTITNSQSLLKLMSIELVMPSNHLILCRPLLLPPSIFPSIRVFSNESDLHIRWPKNWSFSFSISPSNEYSGLISFRIDWFDLLAVQGNLKSLLQHHSPKESNSFFGAQLSLESNSHIHTGSLEKP